MFCIRSDVITLRSIEMYGLVTVWTSMMMGHIGSFYSCMSLMIRDTQVFRRLTVVNGTLRFWGVTKFAQKK